MVSLLFNLILADVLVVLPCATSANGSERQFYCSTSYWLMKYQIYHLLDLPMDLNGKFTVSPYIDRLSGRCTGRPTPHRSVNESEWQFYGSSSYWQKKWQIYCLLDLPMNLNANFTVPPYIGRVCGKSTCRSTPHLI